MQLGSPGDKAAERHEYNIEGVAVPSWADITLEELHEMQLKSPLGDHGHAAAR